MHQENASGLWKHRCMKDGFMAAQSSLEFSDTCGAPHACACQLHNMHPLRLQGAAVRPRARQHQDIAVLTTPFPWKLQ